MLKLSVKKWMQGKCGDMRNNMKSSIRSNTTKTKWWTNKNQNLFIILASRLKIRLGWWSHWQRMWKVKQIKSAARSSPWIAHCRNSLKFNHKSQPFISVGHRKRSKKNSKHTKSHSKKSIKKQLRKKSKLCLFTRGICFSISSKLWLLIIQQWSTNTLISWMLITKFIQLWTMFEPIPKIPQNFHQDSAIKFFLS